MREAGIYLGGLALARGSVDRSTVRRNDAEWVAAAWADPGTRVLVLERGKAAVRTSEDGTGLVLVPPSEAPSGLRFLLGVDESGRAFFGTVPDGPEAAGTTGTADSATGTAAGATGTADSTAGTADSDSRRASLREAGPLLSDRDAGLFTHALALANWHGSHTHCPRCGAPTRPLAAGHARVCTADGSEHFPRTDPAVIMLVTDEQDRCLLARNRNWPEGRVSILAGFVEPGESAEHAVIREVAEETGITVTDVRYVASQPWPMPQSLMLGFRARAASGQQIRVDSEEITEAHWFGRAELRDAVASGGLRLPPPVSIAHQIIGAWYGEPLPRAW